MPKVRPEILNIEISIAFAPTQILPDLPELFLAKSQNLEAAAAAFDVLLNRG
jgi:hypothetical protein